ncbi:MAG TPA: 2-oxoacid:acceptor oxidoreductase subunit alpha [Chloroflexota bacterium]|nr:2-oxoacid:acceptor oxidoreductase subunit alpha [Chloroflexota bacterium]
MTGAVKTGSYFVQGDVAIAEGAIAAGCRYFAGYPITPVSELSETMAERMPEVGGICMQMEDELASIHSAAAASVGGLKSMTASSGPGISLKLEGLGWAIKNEIPVVIVDVQRAGPSNGVATNVGQADFYTVRYGAAGGNAEIIALSPKSVQEAFDLTIECFNLAEVFRCPVFLLTDETVGHMRERLVIPPESEVDRQERIKPKVAPEQFLMYPLEDPEAISYPFPNIGEGFGICVSPYTHTSKGYDTTTVEGQYKMARRLVAKVRAHLDMLVRVERVSLEDAEIAVVSYGGVARPALSAVQQARADGIRAGMLRPIIVWPFPDGEVEAVAERVHTILVPEINLDGQMVREVERAAHGKARVVPIPHAGVEPHRPVEILEQIRRFGR